MNKYEQLLVEKVWKIVTDDRKGKKSKGKDFS